MATVKEDVRRTGTKLAGDRVPPQAHDAEVAVLGAMMLDMEAIGAGAELLTPESFYRDSHRKIFRAIMELFSKSEAVDLVKKCFVHQDLCLVNSRCHIGWCLSCHDS